MGLKFSEDAHEIETEVTGKDVNIAMSLITALIVKGHAAEDVSKVLAVAHAVSHTIFSPHPEAAKINTDAVAQLVHGMVGDMWASRDKLEAELKAKVDRLQPVAHMHDLLGSLLRGRPAPPPAEPEKPHEPQTEQFRR